MLPQLGLGLKGLKENITHSNVRFYSTEKGQIEVEPTTGESG